MAITRNMPKRKRSEHYVNNKEFLAALVRLREDREIAEIKGLPKPPIPRYIGECFFKDCKPFIIQTKLCKLYV